MRRPTERPLINLPMLLKTMGWLLMIEGIFMLFPMGISLLYSEPDWRGFAVASVLTVACGMLLTQRVRPKYSHMGRREGFLLTASIWVVFSVYGMLPFIFNIRDISITDAFFETMSGFTTTGASVISSDVDLSYGIHLWRALTQWIGGMGIILFTIAVIPMLNSSGGMQMFNAEVTGITHEKVRPRISQTAKALWLTYILLTAAAFGCLVAGPMNWFDSLCHAMGTLSTGGYSTLSSGPEEYGSVYVYLILTLFMFLGGINFGLLIRAIYQGPVQIWRNEIFRIFVYCIGGSLILFMISISFTTGVTSVEDILIKPLFQIVSMFSSTGYTVQGFTQWGTLTLGLIFIMMYVGGCAGSTSGGSKIDRSIVLFKYCRNEINRCIHPSTITTVKVNSKVQPHGLVSKVVAFMCLYAMVIILGALIIMVFGENPVHAFFSAFSCISNTGISAGDALYGNDYSTFAAPSKWVLSGIMLIGRLELYTILILVTRAFWRR